MVTENQVLTPPQGGWTPKGEPAIAPEQLQNWRNVIARLGNYAEARNFSRTAVAQRADVPLGTLSAWFDGKYAGNYESIGARIIKWLDAEEDRKARLIELPDAPDYVETQTSRSVWDTLLWAQQAPGMVAITLGAGMGKTTTAEKFREMNVGTYLITMRPSTATMRAMVREIARVLSVTETRPHMLDAAIGTVVRRNGRKTLMMIDEAQNLTTEAVDQLRFWLDQYKCGIALIGNMDIQHRYGGAAPREGYGQIHRRISKRVQILKPTAKDIAQLLDAWRVEDAGARKLLTAIGHKPGALGQIVETLKLALLIAGGNGEPLGADHVRIAWVNRGNEEMR